MLLWTKEIRKIHEKNENNNSVRDINDAIIE